MPAVVVDTHAIVWYLFGDARLSLRAADALDSATAVALGAPPISRDAKIRASRIQTIW
jgi:PIN domain nuclease of toxin-antitoxin system